MLLEMKDCTVSAYGCFESRMLSEMDDIMAWAWKLWE